MIKYYYSLMTLGIMLMLWLPANAQQLKKTSQDNDVEKGFTFSHENEKYLDEVALLFEKYNSKRRQTKNLFEELEITWYGGYFTEEQKEKIYRTSELFLERQAPAYPYLHNYLRSLIGFVRTGHEPQSYDEWNKALQFLLRDRNFRLQKINDFLEFSYKLHKRNILNDSRTARWTANKWTSDRTFAADSVALNIDLDQDDYNNQVMVVDCAFRFTPPSTDIDSATYAKYGVYDDYIPQEKPDDPLEDAYDAALEDSVSFNDDGQEVVDYAAGMDDVFDDESYFEGDEFYSDGEQVTELEPEVDQATLARERMMEDIARKQADVKGKVMADRMLRSISLSFENVNLTCFAKRSNSNMYKTSGIYYPIVKEWVGKGGRVTWERAGYHRDSVFAKLDNYRIHMRYSQFEADSVMFTNTAYFDAPIMGKMVEKVKAEKDTANATYPRFVSYNKMVKINNVMPNINYEGGFNMRGAKFIGSGSDEQLAKLEVLRNEEVFFIARSKHFVFSPERFIGINSSVSFKLGIGDSVWHPGLLIKYRGEWEESFKDAKDPRKNTYVKHPSEIELIRNNKGKAVSPYTNTYHNFTMDIEYLQWPVDSPTMTFRSLPGSAKNEMSLQSLDYYSEDDYRRLQLMDPENPLVVIRRFAKSRGMNTFYGADLAAYMRKPSYMIRQRCMELANKGFLDYDIDKDVVTVKPLLYDYIQARLKKKDYDVIRLKSSIERTKYNGELQLDSLTLLLRGVPYIHVSDSQNVAIVPYGEMIRMRKNRDFDFDGIVMGGLMDYFGKQFTFNYDSFKLELRQIDSMKVNVLSGKVNKKGEPLVQRVHLLMEQGRGSLLIDKADNKSGLKENADYPVFNSLQDCYVFYDKADSAYTRGKEAIEREIEGLNTFMVIPPPPPEIDSTAILDSIAQAIADSIAFAEMDIDDFFASSADSLTADSLALDSLAMNVDSMDIDDFFAVDDSIPVPADSLGFVPDSLMEDTVDREFSFRIYPFQIRDLNSLVRESWKLKGWFRSGDIFPDMEEDLTIQLDIVSPGDSISGVPSEEILSWGFERKNEEPIQLYGGKGTSEIAMKLSILGLRASGKINYLNSVTRADDFRLYPDSVNADALTHNEKQQTAGVEYPQVRGSGVYVHWMPRRDKMWISSQEKYLLMYENWKKGTDVEMDGTLLLEPKGLSGDGKMMFERAEVISTDHKYRENGFYAETATFNLLTDGKELAFKTDNVNAKISFEKRKGIFKMNNPNDFVEFPANRYICYIDEFTWTMDNAILKIGTGTEGEIPVVKMPVEQLPDSLMVPDYSAAPASPNDSTGAAMPMRPTMSFTEFENKQLEGSKYVSVHPKQDSIWFYSNLSYFDLKTNLIEAKNVQLIRVQDATVYPSTDVVVGKNAKIDQLQNSLFLANNDTRFHKITSAQVNLYPEAEDIDTLENQFAKRYYKFWVSGDYKYVDVVGREQIIKFKEITYDSITNQTYGKTEIPKTQDFMLSPRFDFYGESRLYANNKFLVFDGWTQIKYQCSRVFGNNWYRFETEIDPAQVLIPVTADPFARGTEHFVNIFVSTEASHIYSTFLSPRMNWSDSTLLYAKGVLLFDSLNQEYLVSDIEKLSKPYMAGNQIALNPTTCRVTGEGKISLGVDLGEFKIASAGDIVHSPGTDRTSLDLMMSLDFFFEKGAIEIMRETIENAPKLIGVDPTREVYRKALVEFTDTLRAKRLMDQLSLKGKFGKVPKELQSTIVFSDIKLEWDNDTRSFKSVGELGVGNIGDKQINKFVKGYVQVTKRRSGDVFTMYLEPEPGKWFYFSYSRKILKAIASDHKIVEMLTKKKEKSRKRKKEEKEDESFMYMITNRDEKNRFIEKFTGQSYDPDDDIDTPAAGDDFVDDDVVDDDVAQPDSSGAAPATGTGTQPKQKKSKKKKAPAPPADSDVVDPTDSDQAAPADLADDGDQKKRRKKDKKKKDVDPPADSDVVDPADGVPMDPADSTDSDVADPGSGND